MLKSLEKKKINFTLIQIVVWVIVYLLMLIYSMRSRETMQTGFIFSTNNLFTCLLAIYSQSHWLVPSFLNRGKRLNYFMMAAIVLIALVLLRVTLDYVLINLHLGITHFYNLSVSHFAFAFLAIFLCFIIGFLIRVSLDHVHLLKHHEALQHQQVVSELNLLKVQVQPHFMFNTLNNIYSLAHKKSDKTAEVVAKLSDIMRYFVHDAVKETVLLSTEISFVKSYIELERIRMLHPLCVEFEINTTGHEVLIPPMLFIPFVENFFKHGLDKTKTDNSLWIELLQNDHEISFIIKNRILKNHPVSTAGVGIENVKKRLLILYQNNFDLRIKEENNLFSVSLKIPSHYELSLPNRR